MSGLGSRVRQRLSRDRIGWAVMKTECKIDREGPYICTADALRLTSYTRHKDTDADASTMSCQSIRLLQIPPSRTLYTHLKLKKTKIPDASPVKF